MRPVQCHAEGQLLARLDEARAVKLCQHLLPGKPGVDQALHAQRFGKLDRHPDDVRAFLLAYCARDTGMLVELRRALRVLARG